MSLPSFKPSQYGFDSGVIGCGIGRSTSIRLLSPSSMSYCLQRPAKPFGNAAPHNPGFIDVGEEIKSLSAEGDCLPMRHTPLRGKSTKLREGQSTRES